MKRNQHIIIAFGILALFTAIFGYSGIIKNIVDSDPYSELKSESYRIIDKAQLWYGRPEASSGGNRSFIGLNFAELGYSTSKDSLSCKHKNIVFDFQNLKKYSFDLQATSPDGNVFAARGLAYNTHPEIHQEVKK